MRRVARTPNSRTGHQKENTIHQGGVFLFRKLNESNPLKSRSDLNSERQDI